MLYDQDEIERLNDRVRYWRYQALARSRSLFSSTFQPKPQSFGALWHEEAKKTVDEALAEIEADPDDKTIGGNINPWAESIVNRGRAET
jgi:hypothetical protein